MADSKSQEGIHLDIFGQQPLLNIYTQICLCYPVSEATLQDHIVNTLSRGLERLSASFPWTAGQIINEGAGRGSSGVFKIIPFERSPQLVTKDLKDDSSVPSLEAMRKASFPFSMLDEGIICPRNTFQDSSDESKPVPVFLVQATFIEGGLILSFTASHRAMDMTGQAQVIDLISKACGNKAFTDEEIRSGNLSRRHLIPLLDNYVPSDELAKQMIKSDADNSALENTDEAAPQSPKNLWAYFSFNSSSLEMLKSSATDSILSGYVSTDDALTAFVWQCVMRARLPRLDRIVRCTLARAVDVRRYLNVSPTYPGLIQNMSFHNLAIEELLKAPLGTVSSNLRSSVDPQTSDLAFRTRALATYMENFPGKSNISFVAGLDLSVDLMLSSWAKPDCYNLDFNLGLGKPVAVRRPRFTPVESLVYFMPKSLDGEIVVALGLREEDMNRLKVDTTFTKWARYIG